MRILRGVAALWWFAWIGVSQAGELRLVVQSETAPYMYHDKNGIYRGIAIDILEATARRMGESLSYRETSLVRLLLDAKNLKGIDGAAPVQGNDGDGLYYTDPFFGFEDAVMTRRASRIEVATLTDLDRYNFSIWQNGWRSLGPEFEAKYHPDSKSRFPTNYHEYVSHETIVKVFWAKLVDAAVVDRYVFNWYTKQLSASMDTTDPLTVHTIFPIKSMHKVAFRDSQLRDRFNAALKEITADGTVREIMRKY
jgi:polar amino acid transport system substrate-binding protein